MVLQRKSPRKRKVKTSVTTTSTVNGWKRMRRRPTLKTTMGKKKSKKNPRKTWKRSRQRDALKMILLNSKCKRSGKRRRRSSISSSNTAQAHPRKIKLRKTVTRSRSFTSN